MKVKDPATFRELRLERRLSQDDLANLCRCSQNAISLIERGKMLTLSEALAQTMADRLGVPWRVLFEARDNPGVRRVTNGARTGGRPKISETAAA